ncbi:hypothetical protein GE061_004348 [Apolygus lucorum]|uniref:Peptidase S1 domain-containing protein n=1 Tax=Apolygus lucorum TaxID=248454 RepID=A0A8S9WYY1_APOLU|nr:hypothetical protein GE061_004348 [Apolygus lucorum]
MGPRIRLLLAVLICAVRWSHSGHDGRVLTRNEFPQICFINRNGGFVPINDQSKLCLGVIHGSITIITTAPCLWEIIKNETKGTTIRPNQYLYDGNTAVWPVTNLRLTDVSVKEGFNFSFAILNARLPGIPVEPYHDPLARPNPDSTGVEAAIWMTIRTDFEYIIENGKTGAVTTPDKRVIAMTLLPRKTCEEKWSLRTIFDSRKAKDWLSDHAFCAIRSKIYIRHKDEFELVTPGFVCEDDYGAIFFYEGKVVGILVRAFCEFAGPNEPELGVFLYSLPVDDVDKIANVTSKSNQNDNSGQTTRDGRDDPMGSLSSGGLAIILPNRLDASLVIFAVLLITILLPH